jgi:hypothetical protein
MDPMGSQHRQCCHPFDGKPKTLALKIYHDVSLDLAMARCDAAHGCLRQTRIRRRESWNCVDARPIEKDRARYPE